MAIDGHLLFDSAANVDLPPQERRIGYVPQHYALFPHLTVAEGEFEAATAAVEPLLPLASRASSLMLLEHVLPDEWQPAAVFNLEDA